MSKGKSAGSKPAKPSKKADKVTEKAVETHVKETPAPVQEAPTPVEDVVQPVQEPMEPVEDVKGHIDSVNPEPVEDAKIHTKDDMEPPHTAAPEPVKEHYDESPNETMEEEIEQAEGEHSFNDDVYKEVPNLAVEESTEETEWSQNPSVFRKITGKKHTVNGTLYTGIKR